MRSRTCNLEPNLASLDELNSSQPIHKKEITVMWDSAFGSYAKFYNSRVIRIIVHLFNILDLNLSIVLWESKEKSHPVTHISIDIQKQKCDYIYIIVHLKKSQSSGKSLLWTEPIPSAESEEKLVALGSSSYLK